MMMMMMMMRRRRRRRMMMMMMMMMMGRDHGKSFATDDDGVSCGVVATQTQSQNPINMAAILPSKQRQGDRKEIPQHHSSSRGRSPRNQKHSRSMSTSTGL